MKEDKKFVGTIDCTPTWESVLPVLLKGLESDKFEIRQGTIVELTRMAKLANKYVESVKC